MPADLSALRPEFLEAIYGKEKARAILLSEHADETEARRHRRSLRCWLFGHKPYDLCEWGTACIASCVTTCRRCNRTIIPTARIARR